MQWSENEIELIGFGLAFSLVLVKCSQSSFCVILHCQRSDSWTSAEASNLPKSRSILICIRGRRFDSSLTIQCNRGSYAVQMLYGRPLIFMALNSLAICRGPTLTIASLFFTLAFFVQTEAQTVAPSQVTPQTFRPLSGESSAVTIPAAPGLAPPAGAEKLSVTLHRVDIEGGFGELAGISAEMLHAIEHKRLTVAAIYHAAQALEAAYAASGYVLVRVLIPAQKLNDGGVLRIVVLDGFLESIEITGVPGKIKNLIDARAKKIVGKRHIKSFEIERVLLIASELPGLRLSSALSRGNEQGGTKLIVEGTYHPLTGTIGTDNRLPNSVGTWSYNSSLTLNSVMGFGEQFYASLIAPKKITDTFDALAQIRVVGTGVVVPLGTDGWITNFEYTLSRTQPRVAAGTPVSIGWLSRASARTSYPIMRQRSRSLVVNAGFESITQYTELPEFFTELNRDRYNVLRLGADSMFSMPWQAQITSSGLISRGLGGRTQSDAAASGIPLTRQLAEPVFTKASGNIRILQSLPASFQVALIGRGQTSFRRAMLLSEQFPLDAPDGVSSFVSGTFMVDEGATGRMELLRPFYWQTTQVGMLLSPYIFGAGGRGYLRHPTGVERSSVAASSMGLGIRTDFSQINGFAGIAAAIEYGKQYSDLPGLTVGSRTTLSISGKF